MKMDCHISDGPQEPGDEQERHEPDEDAAYDQYRQQCADDGICSALGCENDHMPTSSFCAECAHGEGNKKPQVHTKIGQYTGTKLFSYDKCYWWSTQETAWRMFLKTKKGI
jgi:hypothetical protein